MDEKTRANMHKLRNTWNDVIAPSKLHSLDVMINSIDKNWPISAAPPNTPNIHVNPKFLNNVRMLSDKSKFIAGFMNCN